MKNFKQTALELIEKEPSVSTETIEDMLDDAIEEWHGRTDLAGMPLYEFLGISKEEFATMLSWQLPVPPSIKERM